MGSGLVGLLCARRLRQPRQRRTQRPGMNGPPKPSPGRRCASSSRRLAATRRRFLSRTNQKQSCSAVTLAARLRKPMRPSWKRSCCYPVGSAPGPTLGAEAASLRRLGGKFFEARRLRREIAFAIRCCGTPAILFITRHDAGGVFTWWTSHMASMPNPAAHCWSPSIRCPNPRHNL